MDCVSSTHSLHYLLTGKTRGVLLDGFPRTESQAALLQEMGVLFDRFLLLDVPDKVVMARIEGKYFAQYKKKGIKTKKKQRFFPFSFKQHNLHENTVRCQAIARNRLSPVVAHLLWCRQRSSPV